MARSFPVPAWRLVVLLALLPGVLPSAFADEPGTSLRLACRDDDPFVLCTQGCRNRDYNWRPVAPVAGTWIAVPGYCPWPQSQGACCVGNACFRLWTDTAVRAVAQYMAICPRAHQQGRWLGPGRPDKTPHDH